MSQSVAFKAQDSEGNYVVDRPVTAEEILEKAFQILKRRFRQGSKITQPSDAEGFLLLKLAELEREVFSVLFLDNRHHIIAFETLFQGTIDNTTIYPREVVKRALVLNAAALILAHNHPSGVPEPSESDRLITRRIRDALDIVDIRLLDHFVVGAHSCRSLAQAGYL